MAKKEHLDILIQGVEVWNQWRKKYADIQPDLSRANLHGVKLIDIDLSSTNLTGTNLSGSNLSYAQLINANLSDANVNAANLYKANLTGANLTRAHLGRAYLRRANLPKSKLYATYMRRTNLIKANLEDATLLGANLSHADLSETNLNNADLREAHLAVANFFKANLSNANLSRGNLTGAMLVGTNLKNATLTDCSIYGISVWNVYLEGALQDNLIITHSSEPTITVDNLKVAQFLYLLLNNKEIRDVIDTITSKVVLILGRFTPERKIILDIIRDELRKNDYLPILFDFDKPTSRDIHETITTLARLARFVIADITNPKSIPEELASIVETLPSLPIQPLLKNRSKPWGMYDHVKRYPWVLPVYRYANKESLLEALRENVIDPAEQKARELHPI